jgi:recombination protein RecA
MPLARVDLESLLRTRRLDRTLTTALPPLDPRDEAACAPSGVLSLDAPLGGGFPRGQLSEVVGPRSSGRTSVMLQTAAAATGRGELVALVDALDMFDVESAAAAGVDLDRLLWIRGHVVSNPGLCRDTNQRALEQAIRAFTLVLQAGNFGLVIFDAAEAPAEAIRRLPFTTWLRLQRMVEGSQTMCLLVGGEPMARSSAGLTLRLRPQGIRPPSPLRGFGEPGATGIRFGPSLFEGLTVEARVVRARVREREEATAAFSTVVSDCA